MSTSSDGSRLAKDAALGAVQLESWRKDFAGRWGSSPPPRIEDYLEKAPEGEAERVVRALLAIELRLRLRDGEKPRASEYVARFRAHEAAVREVFAGMKQRSAEARREQSAISATQSAMPPTQSFTQPDAATAREVPAGTHAEPVPERIDRFEVVSVLGRGGFGTVYQARDPKLNRNVAIKVPRLSILGRQEEVARFLREARAAATLSHPNICPIHEIGQQQGRPFIVMALIEGRPLSDFIARQVDIKPRQAAMLVHKLAGALSEAHRAGIIHRDVKPGNIMIDRRGQPILMDFGLARQMLATDPCLTRGGAVMGTPAYMAPEQARGDTAAIGPATDVFALGAVLYELLTGRRAFPGNAAEVVEQIQHVDPRPPRELRADVDPRLEAICLKALAKDPARRYRSMKALDEDLTQYLAGHRSVPADDAGATQNFAAMLKTISDEVTQSKRSVRTWIPVAASLAGAMLVGVILLLGIIFFARTPTATVMINIDVDVKDPSLTFFLDGKQILGEALTKPIELKIGKHELIVQKDGRPFRSYTFEVSGDGTPSIHLAEKDKVPGSQPLVDKPAPPSDLVKSQQREGTQEQGVKFTNLSPGRSARILGDGALTYWSGIQPRAAFDAEGRNLVVLTSTRLAHTWDSSTGRLTSLVKGLGHPLALSRTGRLAVSCYAEKLIVWRVESGETVLRTAGRLAACAAFSPDERQLVAGYTDGRIELISLEAGGQVRTIRASGVPAAAVAFSPSGRLLAMIDSRGGQSLLDAASWQVLHTLSEASDVPRHAQRIAFSESLNRLAFSGLHEIELWDTKTGRLVGRVTPPQPFGAVEISPDGRSLAVCTDHGTVCFFSVERGTLVRRSRPKPDLVVALCFTPDGRRLAAAGHYSVTVVDAYTDKVLAEPTVSAPVDSLRFSPGGGDLFAGTCGVLHWHLASNRWSKLAEVPELYASVLAVSKDGGRLFYRSFGTFVACDSRTGGRLASVKNHYAEIHQRVRAAVSEDGAVVAAVSEDRQISIRNLLTLQLIRDPWPVKQDVQAISLDAAGKRLAVATADGALTVYEVAQGAPTHTFSRSPTAAGFVAFSPDGKTLAARSANGAVLRWNLETRQPLAPLGEGARHIAFSADGRLMAIADEHEHVRIFEVATGKPTHDFVVGPDVPETLVSSMAFSPDGQHLATGNNNGTIYLFPLAGQESERPVREGAVQATAEKQ